MTLKPKLILTTLVVAAAMAVTAPAAFAAAPVQITSFAISPACVRPGSSVTAAATVQNTTLFPASFYTHTTVSEGGYQVYDGGTHGPYVAPAEAPLTQTQDVQVPWYTPWGNYTVTLSIGPSASDSSSWDQRSAPLAVSPWCP